jgi:serine/threonine protein kinase
VSFAVRCLGDYIVNLTVFEKRSIIGDSAEVLNEISHRIEDELLIFMKSIPLSAGVEKSRIENEIQNLINLRHPCIAAPIGFISPIETDSPQELKIVRLYFEGCSLAEVLSVDPAWWTSTVKAKVVAGIVLGIRFAHSHGLFHGHLTGNNILFDSDHCIQIVDFKPIGLEVVESGSESEAEEGRRVGGFSGQRWTPQTDISAFASILFEIVVGRPANGEVSVPTNIPYFVSEIIETGLWSKRGCSFNDILEILRKNRFQIENGVDSAEVFAFINWVESAEQSEK